MLAILCPGQGAQSAGFLTEWLTVAAVADRVTALAAATGLDLVHLGTATDADVVDTAVAQPLLVAAGIATASTLGPLPADTVVVGHSVGELTAAAIAGALDDLGAVGFARRRGHAMACAAAANRAGMTAVLGGDPTEVAAAVERAGCWIANINGAGQIVAGGTAVALERLAAAPPAGARLRPLAVAGAFHTPLMQQARNALSEHRTGLTCADPRLRMLSNADGAVVAAGSDLTERLVNQVTATVRFDACVDTLRALGVSAAIEVAPGGVLTALLRRELPSVRTVALRSPTDLDAAHDLIEQFGGVGEQWTPGWTTVVAPTAGMFRRAESHVVDLTATDAPIRLGSVERRDGTVDVTGSGTVLEWLADDGDPVSTGQPLARLQPAGGRG